jgi:hypothetical protein
MANMLFTNNAATTLASSISSTATSLSVASGTGSLFPNPTGTQYFYCTLQATTGSTIEIIKVTARSSDTFTIIRGQDGTGGSSFTAGDKVELRIVAATMNDLPKLDEVNQFTANNCFGGSSTTTSMGVGYGSLNFYNPTVGSNANTAIYFAASGTGIGAQGYSFAYNNAGSSITAYNFYGDGTAQKTGGGSWSSISDARLKDNVAPLTGALAKINALNPVNYSWKIETTEPTVGFIAQEVQNILPNAVTRHKPSELESQFISDETYTLGFQADMTAYLVGAIKELKIIVDAQAVEIEALKTKTGI